jgi:hypothetical protein
LEEFPSILQPAAATPEPRHGVEHYIQTSGPPVFTKVRRLDPSKQLLAQEEFIKLEQAGIVRR